VTESEYFAIGNWQVTRSSAARETVQHYTVGHKKRATFIFAITLANVDRFQ